MPIFFFLRTYIHLVTLCGGFLIMVYFLVLEISEFSLLLIPVTAVYVQPLIIAFQDEATAFLLEQIYPLVCYQAASLCLAGSLFC